MAFYVSSSISPICWNSKLPAIHPSCLESMQRQRKVDHYNYKIGRMYALYKSEVSLFCLILWLNNQKKNKRKNKLTWKLLIQLVEQNGLINGSDLSLVKLLKVPPKFEHPHTKDSKKVPSDWRDTGHMVCGITKKKNKIQKKKGAAIWPLLFISFTSKNTSDF